MNHQMTMWPKRSFWWINGETTGTPAKNWRGWSDKWACVLSLPFRVWLNYYEFGEWAQTIWIGRRVLWVRLALSASVPAPMKTMWMNFGFVGFLWCHVHKNKLMPFNPVLSWWQCIWGYQYDPLVAGPAILGIFKFVFIFVGDDGNQNCFCFRCVFCIEEGKSHKKV